MRQSYCEILFIFQWRNKLKVYWIGKNSVFKLNCGQEDDGYIMSREIKYINILAQIICMLLGEKNGFTNYSGVFLSGRISF